MTWYSAIIIGLLLLLYKPTLKPEIQINFKSLHSFYSVHRVLNFLSFFAH